MAWHTEEQIAEALRKAGGFQTKAAELLGVTQQAISKRVKESPYLQDCVMEISEYYLDLAEIKLVKALNDEQRWAIEFFLKHKGKTRGYAERHQVEFDTCGDIILQIVPATGNRKGHGEAEDTDGSNQELVQPSRL